MLRPAVRQLPEDVMEFPTEELMRADRVEVTWDGAKDELV